MMFLSRKACASLLSIVLAGAVPLSSFADTEEFELTPVDRALPHFKLQSLDNVEWQAESLRGKPWIINMWATWCPSCIEELPSMNDAWAVLEEEGVGMLAINAGEGREAIENFLEKVSIDITVLVGSPDSLSNWSVEVLPTTLIVDSTGNVIYEAIGPRDWSNESLLKVVMALR